jgi:F0F1-type ATP synthase membrane subunit b/b'
MKKRAGALSRARAGAEQMVKQSREQIQAQVQLAKVQLDGEAEDLARGIAYVVLHRSA